MQTITQTAAGVVSATTGYAVKGAVLAVGVAPATLNDAAGREILTCGTVGVPVMLDSPVQVIGLTSVGGTLTKFNIFVE